MDPEAIFAGIGAVITAGSGVMLMVREFRNRERLAAKAEIAQLAADLYATGQAFIEFRRYTFSLRQQLADNGMDCPPPPSTIVDYANQPGKQAP